MNKETIKFLWEIYNELLEQEQQQSGEDYPVYDIRSIMSKLKIRIDEELK